MRFVIQSLDCLDVHSVSNTDDKAMDESDKRARGRSMRAHTQYVMIYRMERRNKSLR